MGLLQSWQESLRPVVQATDENMERDRGVGELHMAHNQVSDLNPNDQRWTFLTREAHHPRCPAFVVHRGQDSDSEHACQRTHS